MHPDARRQVDVAGGGALEILFWLLLFFYEIGSNIINWEDDVRSAGDSKSDNKVWNRFMGGQGREETGHIQ